LLSIYIEKWIIKVAKLQKVAKVAQFLFVNVVTILLARNVIMQNTLRRKNTSRNRYPKVIHPKWITKK